MRSHRITLTVSFCAFLVALAYAASPAGASAFTLVDGNSSVTIDPSSSAGLSSWLVDSQQTTKQVGLWYRIGATGGQQPLSALTLSSTSTFALNGDGLADLLVANYAGNYAGTAFTVQARWTLQGGSPGSLTSDIQKQVSVKYLSGPALDMHMFEYTDMNLSAADTLTISGDTCIQTGGVWQVKTVSAASAPTSYYQAGLTTGSNTILAAVTSTTAPATLTGSHGPITGDTAWATEWGQNLSASGASMLISTDANLTPEPATLTLLASGLIASFMLRRRKEKK
jgi:PEP-CTERM motif